MKKLIIFHLAPFPYLSGGMDTWLYNFIKKNDHEYNIILFCPDTDKEGKKPIFNISQFSNLEIHYVSSFSNYPQMLSWSLKMYKRSKKIVKNDLSPILVLSTIPTMIPIVLLKILSFIKNPILCSVRGQIAKDAIDLNKSLLFRKASFYLEKTLLKFSDTIIANGWDTQKYLKDFYNYDSVVIPNAFNKSLNIDSTDSDLTKIVNMKKNGKKIVLHVGTLRPVKGIEYILGALKLMDSTLHNYNAVFIGKGHISKYKEYSVNSGINAVFLGEKSNVNDYFRLADVVINVSGGSGVSNSLLESLSLGKTTVCWDNYTFSQVITHKENGYLADYKSEVSLADVIKYALENPLSSSVIKNSVEQFSWESVNFKWIEELERVNNVNSK